MGISIKNVREEAYRLLNETNSSVLGQLPDGTGGADTITSTNGVTTFIVEAITDLCKTCVYIPVTASASIPANALSLNITDSTAVTSVSNGGSIWAVTDVYLNPGVRLTHASEQSIRANDLNYITTTTAGLSSIQYWYKPDAYRIALYPRNAGGLIATLTLYGCGVCPLPSNDTETTTLTFLPDDLLKQLLATYVAMKLIMKNIDDPSLAQRMFWRNWYDEQRMKLWMQMDPSMKTMNAPFSAPPIPQQAAK